MTMPDDGLRPEEFAEAASAAIADAQGRSVREAAQVLAQGGLAGVCAPEEDGGLGLDLAFAVPIAHAAGRLRLQFPLVEQLLLARALAGMPEAAALAAGDKVATIAWRRQADLAGPARHVSGSDWALVPDAAGEGAALLDLAGSAIEADEGLDPEFPQEWLRVASQPVLARLDAGAYAELQHQSRVLFAAWANGAAEGAIEATANYLANRVQFGRPLSAKQAVRHTLARMKLLQEVSAAAVQRVLWTDEFGQARAAQTALAGSLTHAAFVLEKAIHLHGGMGFTWDIPLHYALREVRKFDAMFGTGSLVRELGRRFIETA